MKPLLLLSLAMMSVCAYAREQKQPYVAFSYSEFAHPQYDKSVKDVFVNGWGNKVVVKKENGKTRYPVASVWGFMPKDGHPYRISDGDVYRIDQVDTLTIYHRRIGGKYRHSRSYFSNGLNGQILDLSSAGLKKAYKDTNPEFITRLKKDLKWYQDYDCYSNKHKTYKIIEIYKKTIS